MKNLETLLEKSIDYEARLISLFKECIKSLLNPSLKQLVQSIIDQDQIHIKKFIEILDDKNKLESLNEKYAFESVNIEFNNESLCKNTSSGILVFLKNSISIKNEFVEYYKKIADFLKGGELFYHFDLMREDEQKHMHWLIDRYDLEQLNKT